MSFERPDAQALELGDVWSHFGEAILSFKDRNNWLDSTLACDSYSAFNISKRKANSVIYASNRIINHTLVTDLECLTALKKVFESRVAS